nr:cysteine desulfurase-like protein [Lysinibacillus timonensis]
MIKQFPINKVRSQFPALSKKVNDKSVVYFDGPGGTQMAEASINEMLTYINNGMANLHGAFHTSLETEEMLEDTRKTISAFLGCLPEEIAFGPNMTTLAFSIARSIAPFITEGDEIVVTELDHRANVDPWLTLARDKGAVVKFIKVHQDNYTLELDELENIITEKTKLVAVGYSSNVTGTVNDIQTIGNRAKEVGAFMIVDAVHAAPHIPLDFKNMNIDILLCSAYKFFGPHVGMAVIQRALFERLSVYKLDPAPEDIPYKLETGTQNHEGIAGILGALRFISELGEGSTIRERLVSGIQTIDEYETQLGDLLESFLKSKPYIKLYRPVGQVRKTPTFAFTIDGHHSRDVTKWFADHHQIYISDGDFYASTLATKLRIHKNGGWIRIGLTPYNTLEEIERFKEALAQFETIVRL